MSMTHLAQGPCTALMTHQHLFSPICLKMQALVFTRKGKCKSINFSSALFKMKPKNNPKESFPVCS